MRTFLRKFLNKTRKDQEGITGLETAIILIAFVIVASVFAYVVLSAGLYSSQKAKEAITAGLQSTMSTIEVKGNMIAKMEGGVVTHLYFCVGIPAAGSPVDFSPPTSNTSLLIISYSDADHLVASMNWTIEKLAMINADDILDPTELFQVDVIFPTSGITIGAYDKFSLEVKPADGPVLTLERTLPARINEYVNLH
jgi:flagellin FlaB